MLLVKRANLTLIRKALAPQRADLLRLMRTSTPAYRRAFLDAIRATAGEVVLVRVSEAIERGDYAAAEAAIPWERMELELGGLAVLFRQGYENAALLTLGHMPQKIQAVLRFDLLNPRSVDFIRLHTADLVREVALETRLAIRDVIGRAFIEGMHPYESARHIRSLIGLTQRQAGAVDRYRGGLIRQGVSQGKAEEMARTYANKQLDWRAENVARSETAAANNAGCDRLWQQAAEEGYIDRNTARRVWMTAGDERVCDWCQELEGEEVMLDESFTSSVRTETGLYRDKTTKYPPLHPACRCVLALLTE